MRCRKFRLNVEDNSCSLYDCEYYKSCMGESKNIKIINSNETILEKKPESEPSIEPTVVVSESILSESEVISEPKVESDVVKPEIIEPLNIKELKLSDIESFLVKQLYLNNFNVKKLSNGINVSMNVTFPISINLVMSKKIASALSKALDKNSSEK